MVNKITTPPTQNEVIDKINELVDGKQDTISDLATIRSGAKGNVKLNGGSSQQTISLTSGTGTTPLGIKSMASSSYISFNGSMGWLASFGITNNKKPTVYDGSSHEVAYVSDIPTVNNATLTIQKNGTNVATFTANASSNVTANISVPTTTSSVTSGSSAALTSGGAYTNLVRRKSTSAATGSASQGVYVDANGQVQTCTAVTSTYAATGTAPVNGVAVSNAIATKQDTLVSGTNIKTINGDSLLGSGNIVIQAGADTNITNCITEIPQDIKLELNNGTLTLKAGSKVYVPNGAGVFDTKTYTNDSTYTLSYNGIYFIFSFETSGIHSSLVTSTYSGPTAPTVSGSAYWYDTTNNKIKYTTDSGSTWQGNNISLPLAIITVSNGAISNIDQVFNGFGYMGSTVFALPEVKGLIPNGRNEDGTLKSRLLTLTKVATGSYSGTATLYFGCSNDSGAVYFQSTNMVKYEPETNTTNWGVCIFGSFKSVSGVFSDYTPKTVFHALGYNDSSTISGWAMPSNRFINLTLGANGTQYTAPANGMLYFAKKATAVNQYIGFVHSHYQEMMRASGAVDIFVNTLVRKGETVSVVYTADGTGQYDKFLFIYAEGEKNV